MLVRTRQMLGIIMARTSYDIANSELTKCRKNECVWLTTRLRDLVHDCIAALVNAARIIHVYRQARIVFKQTACRVLHKKQCRTADTITQISRISYVCSWTWWWCLIVCLCLCAHRTRCVHARTVNTTVSKMICDAQINTICIVLYCGELATVPAHSSNIEQQRIGYAIYNVNNKTRYLQRAHARALKSEIFEDSQRSRTCHFWPVNAALSQPEETGCLRLPATVGRVCF